MLPTAGGIVLSPGPHFDVQLHPILPTPTHTSPCDVLRGIGHIGRTKRILEYEKERDGRRDGGGIRDE